MTPEDFNKMNDSIDEAVDEISEILRRVDLDQRKYGYIVEKEAAEALLRLIFKGTSLEKLRVNIDMSEYNFTSIRFNTLLVSLQNVLYHAKENHADLEREVTMKSSEGEDLDGVTFSHPTLNTGEGQGFLELFFNAESSLVELNIIYTSEDSEVSEA